VVGSGGVKRLFPERKAPGQKKFGGVGKKRVNKCPRGECKNAPVHSGKKSECMPQRPKATKMTGRGRREEQGGGKRSSTKRGAFRRFTQGKGKLSKG